MLAIVLLCLAQVPTLEDLELIRAVEESVIAGLPHPRRLEDGMPPIVAAFVRDMGAPCIKCRDRATEAMEYCAQKNIRWLFWGLRSTDAEVRSRCQGILKRIPPRCEVCGGIPHRSYFECRTCNGTGATWAGLREGP